MNKPMKQKITKEQFMILSYEQSVNLLKRLNSPQKLPDKEHYYENRDEIIEYLIPIIDRITVGRMIELLSENCSCIDCVDRLISNIRIKYYGKEFCDALWLSLIQTL